MLTINAVYFPSFIPPEEFSLNPVAIRPKFGEKSMGRWIEWNDTSRGSSYFYLNKSFVDLKGQLVSEEAVKNKVIPNQISCHLQNGKDLSLILLTKSIYDQFLKDLIGIDFKSDEEIQEYFLITNFDV